MNPDAESRIDPGLALRAREYTAEQPKGLRALGEAEAGRDAGADAPRVHIGVKFTGDVDELTAVGLEVQSLKQHESVPYSIAFGTIGLDALAVLGAVEHVLTIEGSPPLHPQLDTSLTTIRAKELHTAAPTPYTGTGVVVGVIDGGFDLTHPNFIRANGTSRVLDHLDQAPGGTPRLDHGTHVAGIAAGDGSAPGRCSGPGTFTGVAPDADLLLVSYGMDKDDIGDSLNLPAALDWIWDHPKAAGRPIVINISLGQSQGPHDGTSLVETAMDIDLLASGRAVVVAAGNEGQSSRHADGTVTAAGTRLELEMGIGNTSARWLELYYPLASELHVQLTMPGWSPASSPVVEPNQSGAVVFAEGKVEIESRHRFLDAAGARIFVKFTPTSPHALPAGTWKLALTSPSGDPVEFDAYIDRNDHQALTFVAPHVSRRRTVTTPATGRQTITVGAYAEPELLGLLGNAVADFSSFGPARGTRPATAQKPDLVAPGVGITSAKPLGAGAAPLCDCCLDSYQDMPGTSMAAPHVAGVVALMFQKNPDLAAWEIRNILRQSARRPDGFSGTLPDSEWGAGIVDAAAAVALTPAPGPSPLAAPVTTARFGARTTPRPGSSPPDLTPGGELVAALVSTHFSEVRALINAHLGVAAAWHRMQGPALLRALLGRLTPGAGPAHVDVAIAAPHAAAFFAALERYGSEALREDLARYASALRLIADPDVLAGLLGPPIARAA